LKKIFLYAALVLLFIGIIAIFGTINMKSEIVDWDNKETLARKTGSELDQTAGSWSISGNFSSGRKLRVVIQPGPLWQAQEVTYQYAYIKLPVSIYDPHGGETKVNVVFTKPTDPYSKQENLQFDHVELISKSDGLTFEEADKLETRNGTDFYNDFWAIVEFDGNYTVTVFRTWGVFDPPAVFRLESLPIWWEYPYWFVTVAGGCLVFIALLLLLMIIWKSRQPKFRYKIKTDVKKAICLEQFFKVGKLFIFRV